jgi:hypothetical protein
LKQEKVSNTIVIFGSARAPSPEELSSKDSLSEGRSKSSKLAEYYEATRMLSKRLTEWSKHLNHEEQKYVICSGGGPGIMIAANRGAREAEGKTASFRISLPFEDTPNPYVSEELDFEFHYFLAIRSALWNIEGEKEFFVSSDNGDSSIFEPMKFNEIYRVKTERLEKYVNKEIKLLKVEGEGAEPEIIEGIGPNIEYIHFISADLGGERGLLSEYTVVQVTNFLLLNNFELIDFSPDRFIFLFQNKKFMTKQSEQII